MERLIAPSILSADFSRLEAEIRSVEAGGADWLHVDVMDGHFVPNLTIGPPVVASLRPITKLPLDCHLMVTDPSQWIEPFVKAGADGITIHVETIVDAQPLRKIRSAGKRAGISLNPETPLSRLEPFLSEVDLVLVMSVRPGFGGQAFMEGSFDRIRDLVGLRKGREFLIEVDGGVGASNAKALADAGAQVLVAGHAIFSKKDRTGAMADLRR